MPIVVATRLEARGLRSLWPLTRLTAQVARQLRSTPGFLGGALLMETRLRPAAWTVSVWADRASLSAFREAHQPVAAHGEEIADVLATTAWLAVDDNVPTWGEVHRHWPSVPAPRRGLRGSIPSARVAAPPPRERTLT